MRDTVAVAQHGFRDIREHHGMAVFPELRHNRVSGSALHHRTHDWSEFAQAVGEFIHQALDERRQAVGVQGDARNERPLPFLDAQGYPLLDSLNQGILAREAAIDRSNGDLTGPGDVGQGKFIVTASGHLRFGRGEHSLQ